VRRHHRWPFCRHRRRREEVPNLAVVGFNQSACHRSVSKASWHVGEAYKRRRNVGGFTGISRRSPYRGIETVLQHMTAALLDKDHHCTSQYVDRHLRLYLGWGSDRATENCLAEIIRH